MTAKERITTALNHSEPDRLPVDFGSTPVTGIHVQTLDLIRKHFGLEDRPVKVGEPYQMLGLIEEDVMEALGLDAEPVIGHSNIFGFRNTDWKPFKTPWGQDVLVPEDFRVTTDTNGDVLIYPQGDTSVPPSGRMPFDGFFFDSIIRQPPIDEDKLNPEDNLEEFSLMDENTLNWYRGEAERLRNSSRAIVAGGPGTAFGDIALVPAPFLTNPKGIRDVTEWYMSTAMRTDYVHAIFDKQCEIALENLAMLKDIAGDIIDVLFICGTDFGTQTSQFCSVDTFRDLYAPYYKKVNNWVHSNTNWKTFKHSCGAVYPFIDDFIDCGFDILNPVQCSATGMDPKTLKDEFGSRITFWGGGVDTQHTLPFGTPGEVYREVRERIDIFAPGGGFVFNTIHNMQANTPIENVAALFKAISDAGNQ